MLKVANSSTVHLHSFLSKITQDSHSTVFALPTLSKETQIEMILCVCHRPSTVHFHSFLTKSPETVTIVYLPWLP